MRTYTCSNCGKKFINNTPGLWIYKRTIKGKRNYYCSYSCYNLSDPHNKDRMTDYIKVR